MTMPPSFLRAPKEVPVYVRFSKVIKLIVFCLGGKQVSRVCVLKRNWIPARATRVRNDDIVVNELGNHQQVNVGVTWRFHESKM
ncbi:MAG: hypothetical protein Q8L65_02730, partial [Burkholderiales bacterium]|nr:hypothetical protein [Burkholderiales bacterium]